MCLPPSGWLSSEVSTGWCPLLGCGSKEARTRSTRIRSAHLGSTVNEKGIVMTMIGIDPHKATHTAVAVDDDEQVIGEFTLEASDIRLSVSSVGLTTSIRGSGQSSPRTVSAIWSVGSSSQLVRRGSMSRRCSQLEYGYSARDVRRRTIRTMPVRSRSRRCVQTAWQRSSLMIMWSCCACW